MIDPERQPLEVTEPCLPVEPAEKPLPLVEDIEEGELWRDDEVEQNGERYAWTRVARWVNQFGLAWRDTRGDFTALDICSAVPINAELLRALHFKYCGKRADKRIVAGYAERFVDQTNQSLDDRTKAALSQVIFRRGSQPRVRLASMVQATIFQLPDSINHLPEDEQQTLIADSLLAKLVSSRESYRSDPRPGPPDPDQGTTLEHVWGIHTQAVHYEQTFTDWLADVEIPTARAVELGRTFGPDPELRQKYREALRATAPVGEEQAWVFARHFAEESARLIIAEGLNRAFASYSLDVESAAELLKAARQSFTTNTQELGIFKRAINRLESGDEHHLTYDLFDPERDLPIENESISQITIFEGWPFYFKIPAEASPAEKQYYKDFAQTRFKALIRKLKPGGRMVIWPWQVLDGGPEDIELLDQLFDIAAEEGRREGAQLVRYSAEQVREWMTEEERDQTARNSPLMQAHQRSFTGLLFVKPDPLKRDIKPRID